ncbi:F-box/LRR-repeat protein 21-like [Liolophura sinensis]|uniref:F-box/LRR-repeat protein 21-like n=1 Tax=Liolophura sinensis TaxID=3198878 RepID=UPI0031584662
METALVERNAKNVVDFGELPDIVWVEIMKLLTLEDRYHLSVCCRALYDAFNHPSLWHTVNISLLGTSKYSNFNKGKVEVPHKYYELVKKFAHCFQDLTLKICGDLHRLSEDWLDILMNLESSGCYHLERLTLDVGQTKSKVGRIDAPPDTGGIYALLGFVRSATKLKSLVIQAWPLHQNLNCDKDIVTVILENATFRNHLEMLSLYWPKKTDWVTKNGTVPTVKKTVELVNHLHAVQHLSLRSDMLHEDVINSLAKKDHAPMKRLEVLVIYCEHSNLAIPEIPSASWIALKQQSPKLQVRCSVMTRTPAIELAAMLKPEVPLVAIEFLKHSSCDSEVVLSLAAKYSQTLRTFMNFIDSTSGEASVSDNVLLALVERCQCLKYLVYHNSVHFLTVQRLSKMRRKDWEQFEFKEKAIVTQDLLSEEEEEENNDLVILQREPGMYVMRDFRRFHEDQDIRQSRLKATITTVCENVGYNWLPL